MGWAVDQADLGTVVHDATYGASAETFTLTADVAAGAWAIVPLSWIFSATLSSVADDGPGLTWTIVQYKDAGGANVAFAMAYAPAGIPSGTVITATFSGTDTDHRFMWGMSFTGGDASSFDDYITNEHGSDSTPWSSGTYATPSDDMLIVFNFLGLSASTTVDAPSVEDLDTQLSSQHHIVAHRICGAAGNYDIQGTESFDNLWRAITVGLVPAAAGVDPSSPDPAAGGGTAFQQLHGSL